MMMDISGKGMWLWKVPACEGGSGAAITEAALQADLSHVLIKMTDGGVWMNCLNGVDLAAAVIRDLIAAGISVWGWSYVYGAQPEREADTIRDRIDGLNLSGFVVNAEVEYKNRDKQARLFMHRLRAHLSIPVALSSYRFPTFHPSFPFRTFLEFCDYNMPQVYWLQSRNPVEQLERSLIEYRKISTVPVIPTGAAFREAGWSPYPAEVRAFLAQARTMELSAVNFWSWDNCRKYLPAVWNEISDFAWPNPGLPPVPPPAPQPGLSALVTVDGLRVRSQPSISAPILGVFTKGDEVCIGNVGGTNAWVWVEAGPAHPAGWVAFQVGATKYLQVRR